MKHKVEISPLIKTVELRKAPIIIRVNKFDEESRVEESVFAQGKQAFTRKHIHLFQ